MSTKEELKKQKKLTRQKIADKIDLALGDFKNGTDKKKYLKGLEKASKVMSKIVKIPGPAKPVKAVKAVKAVKETES